MDHSREELLSMRADQLHPEDLAKQMIENIEKHASGKIAIVQSEVMTKDKKIIPVSINPSVIELDGKQVLLGIFRDITEQNKIEKKK